MSDDSFIREVDEELRSERVQDFWQRYGKILIAAAVAIILGIAGYGYYEHNTASRAAAQGDTFMAAVRLSEEGKQDEAIAAFGKLESESDDSYRTMARMRGATELVAKGETAEAGKMFDAIIADGAANENMRAIARIRAGLILVDTGTVTEVQARVGALSAPGAPYRASAREAIGLAYYKAGDLENAFKQFEAISTDIDSPQSIKQRVRIMLDVIASKGGPVLKN